MIKVSAWAYDFIPDMHFNKSQQKPFVIPTGDAFMSSMKRFNIHFRCFRDFSYSYEYGLSKGISLIFVHIENDVEGN